jgi:hypothetical protein
MATGSSITQISGSVVKPAVNSRSISALKPYRIDSPALVLPFRRRIACVTILQISGESTGTAPSKPTEPGFVGFEGRFRSMPGLFVLIRFGENSSDFEPP